MEIINNLWVSSCILYERKWDVIIIINDTKIDNLPKDILIFQELDVDKNIKLIHNYRQQNKCILICGYGNNKIPIVAFF